MRRRKPFFCTGLLVAVAFTIIPAFLTAQGNDPFGQPAGPIDLAPAAAPSPTPLDNLLSAPLPSEAPAAQPPASGTEDLASQEQLVKQRTVKDMQEQIRSLFSESQFEAAIDKCEELLRIDPTNSTALLMRERAQRYLVSSSIPPTPVQPQATPAPLKTAAPADGTAATVPGPAEAEPIVVAPPVAEAPPKNALRLSPLIIVVLVLVVLAVLAGGILLWLKNRAVVVPVIPKTSSAGGNAHALGGLVTQPGFFEFDGNGSVSSKPAPFHDQKTMVEVAANRPPAAAAPSSTGETSGKEEEEIDFHPIFGDDDVAKVEPVPVAETKAPQEPVLAEPVRAASASRVDIDLSPILVEAPPAPAGGESSGSSVDEAPRAPSAPKIPAPLTMKTPQPPSIPIDISGMAAPDESRIPAPGDRPAAPPVGLDIAPAALFASGPAADQTASGNPEALSYNSLMFGNDATQGSVPRNTAPAAADDLTLNTFNQEYSSLMFGNVADETKMPPGIAPEEKKPAPTAEEIDKQAPKLVVHDERASNSSDATLILRPAKAEAKASDEEQTVAPVAPSAPKISMFDRQRAAGAAALAAGDLPKAVHCLSIAVSLKPSDKETRDMLEEARARRAAAQKS
ncbi:hypothetical protein IT570_00970 [Candidatus Sumerlaeota bacterium]|nr:hypothetical protein [Candidatus Sumerlaeota bacterium]